jgi:hypothetical protein
LRAIFRACYVRFCYCADKQQCITQTSFEYLPATGETAVMYDRKYEEYSADFISIARRTLDDFDFKLFKFHYLLGADWRLCCTRLKMDRGNFFHAVYRIQQTLGKAYRETKPYGLFPVYEYFEEVRGQSTATTPPDGPTPRQAGIRTGPQPLRLQPQRTVHPYPGEEPSIRRRRIA